MPQNESMFLNEVYISAAIVIKSGNRRDLVKINSPITKQVNESFAKKTKKWINNQKMDKRILSSSIGKNM